MSSGVATPKESQLVIILDDDTVITAVLAEGLEREGRTIITCNDLESAQMVVERMKPSHVISDVRLSGPFSLEGLDFIRFVRQHSPQTRVLLMTGQSTGGAVTQNSFRWRKDALHAQLPHGGQTNVRSRAMQPHHSAETRSNGTRHRKHCAK